MPRLSLVEDHTKSALFPFHLVSRACETTVAPSRLLFPTKLSLVLLSLIARFCRPRLCSPSLTLALARPHHRSRPDHRIARIARSSQLELTASDHHVHKNVREQ